MPVPTVDRDGRRTPHPCHRRPSCERRCGGSAISSLKPPWEGSSRDGRWAAANRRGARGCPGSQPHTPLAETCPGGRRASGLGAAKVSPRWWRAARPESAGSLTRWSVRPGATGHMARVRVAASVKVRAGHAAVAAWAADLNESLRIGRSCGGSVSPFSQVDAM